MPRRLFATAATATLLLLTTTATPAQTPEPMSADQGWASMKRCAQEDTERARHACLDRVLRDAGVLTDEMHARQQRRAFGLEEKPARAPAATAPAPAASSSAAAAEALNRRAAGNASGAATAPPAAGGTSSAIAGTASAANASAANATPSTNATRSASTPPAATAAAPPVQPERLDVELAKVEKATNGRLFVTTTDGAVWLQLESVEMPLPPVAGDHMTIRKGSLGGYRCTIASTHLTYRCARNR